MYYEEVAFKAGETLHDLAIEYGHETISWVKIWADLKNTKLKALRGKPANLQVGDVICIPILWKIKTTTMKFDAMKTKVEFEAIREGKKGKRLRWVQTVDRSNQPFGAAPYGSARYVVDPSSPPDDNQPFYYTALEISADAGRRTKFSDAPFRRAPLFPKGTTEWRAMLSISVITDKRVTVVSTQYWGFDKARTGHVTKVPARKATKAEVQEHLTLLKSGFGLKDLPGTIAFFKDMGWTFRTPPAI